MKWLVAVAVTAMIAAVLWWPADADPPLRSADAVRVGPGPGDSGYALRAQQELASLTGPPVYASVTFAAYLPTSAVAELDVTVAQVHLRAPGGPPRRLITAGDVEAAVRSLISRLEADASGYRRLETEGPADLRDTYADAARTATTDAAALREGRPCVYGAVVHAAPEALKALARQGGILVVDPAPEVTDPAHAVFTPAEPEPMRTQPR